MTIWCVEDDPAIRDIELYTLKSTGFDARGFEDGNTFWEALQKEQPHLIVLDIMLPGQDGIELLRKIRQTPQLAKLPIIMATVKGNEYDKIQTLDLGADDHIVKPFGVMELISRIKAILRRTHPEKASNILKHAGIILNQEEHTVTIDGQKQELTHKEFELLRHFMQHPGVVYTRDQLYSAVWDMNYVGETRTVDMHIRTLRQKLGPYAHHIQTIRHLGYKMEK